MKALESHYWYQRISQENRFERHNFSSKENKLGLELGKRNVCLITSHHAEKLERSIILSHFSGEWWLIIIINGDSKDIDDLQDSYRSRYLQKWNVNLFQAWQMHWG